ncbi:hypothetical protein Bxe_C0491 [Paraburkholderia xenovorans LB400]|uniref:Uncharacterized protein n=1 Tax=Paraburkholderia xenovorans (strain LB400) TaxID=266265 RepID=Q13HP4_PARXL|nr:hypothetical protein Bxe_C0491 [Paraburkholderia xenovorans LB400]
MPVADHSAIVAFETLKGRYQKAGRHLRFANIDTQSTCSQTRGCFRYQRPTPVESQNLCGRCASKATLSKEACQTTELGRQNAVVKAEAAPGDVLIGGEAAVAVC